MQKIRLRIKYLRIIKITLKNNDFKEIIIKK
jgi:hypothetical protein